MSPRQTHGLKMTTKQQRRDYRGEAFPMLFLAFGLTNAGISALFDPRAADMTSVALLIESDFAILEFLWQLSYLVAGVLIFIGVLRPWPVVEVIGEWLAMWAMVVNLMALLIIRGPAGTGATFGAFLFAIAVCVIRIHRLHQRAATERRIRDLPFNGRDRRGTE